jgi:hypothetical protein
MRWSARELLLRLTRGEPARLSWSHRIKPVGDTQVFMPRE